MKRVVFAAPDDVQWNVRVVWEPRWRAFARRFGGWRRKRDDLDLSAGDAIDVADGMARIPRPRSGSRKADTEGDGFDFDDAIVVIAVIFVVVIAAAALFWWVLLPLLLLVLDLIIVVVALVVGVAVRVLFRRPWTIEATSSAGQRFTVDVVGWRAALRQRDEVAESLREGRQPSDPASRAQ